MTLHGQAEHMNGALTILEAIDEGIVALLFAASSAAQPVKLVSEATTYQLTTRRCNSMSETSGPRR